MEKLYQDYKNVAEFFIVYIREAHASDSSWPVPYAKEFGIKKHTSFGERCAVAQKLTKDKKLTIPCLIDNMDNVADAAYHAWPDRVFLIRTDGMLAVAVCIPEVYRGVLHDDGVLELVVDLLMRRIGRDRILRYEQMMYLAVDLELAMALPAFRLRNFWTYDDLIVAVVRMYG